MLQIVLGQDGDIIQNEANIFPLSKSDKRYSKESKKELFDFVGFVIDKKKMLAVFPKKFFEDSLDENKQQISENIILLFKVISKYISESRTTLSADKYMGYEDDFESDYPFEAFFRVYEYYKKYGIYKEEDILLEKSSRGKISWKDTIQKSNVIVSNGNLIFLPLYSKNKSSKDAFISECMVYVINYTIKTFPFFIQLPPVLGKDCKIDFLANREYTLRRLYQYKNTIFKDWQKDLINSLIKFFEQYNKKAEGGPIHFKINRFDMIWEKMVNKYLNDSFVGVDEENSNLIFDNDKKQKIRQFGKETFYIDESIHNFFIEPDHYCEDDDTIYVFDSKYYQDISELNYKQLAYTILLGNSQLYNNKKIYSALILPGNNEGRLHLKLKEQYCQLKPGCNYIIEQFLDVKLLMKNYLNLNIEEEG